MNIYNRHNGLLEGKDDLGVMRQTTKPGHNDQRSTWPHL